MLFRSFAVVTKSESGDNYIYFVEHDKVPTDRQWAIWLVKNGNDPEYENIVLIEEIKDFYHFK